jgi:hypothetical protein
MNYCTCHDPVVFGHHCPSIYSTYSAGETFTAIGAAFRQITANASQAASTWSEVARLVRNSIEDRETPAMSFKLCETPGNRTEP